MSKALIAGINQVATDKGLDREIIFTAIEAALVSAYKRNYGSIANVSAEVDRVSGEMRVFAEREVVEEVFNERTEITEMDAHKKYPTAKLGDIVRVENNPDDFGRIAAQTAKQVILQRIREAERDTVFESFSHQVGEIVRGQVRSIDQQSGVVTVLLDEKHEVLLTREEQIPTEKLKRGDHVKIYVVDVHKSTRGPVIKISRTHRNLLRRLMEQEIPEVRDGIVEMKSIAREPGARSKAAVVATVPGVDPVGSCVGMRGLRIQNIVNELAGEKIDVVEWSTDPATYISNALSPAKVHNVILDEKSSIKTAVVVVPDRQLSLAIGKEGQNARLAAKLTGWRIDIKSETEAKAEGLDQIVFERAKEEVMSKSDEFMGVVENILRGDSRGGAHDRLWHAAQAAQSAQTPQESSDILETDLEFDELLSEGLSLPDVLDETSERELSEAPLPDLPSVEEIIETKTTADAWSAAVQALGEESSLPLTAIEEPDIELSPVEKPATRPPVEPPPTKPVEEAGALASDELPQVITADMLRARMAQRKELRVRTEELEVPAELLVGLDTETETVELDESVWEEESEIKGKGKVKGKAQKAAVKTNKPAPKKKKRRAGFEEEDDFGSYR